MTSRSWVLHAAASAIFAGLTALLAKIGVSQVPSNVATLVRTVVVVVFAAGVVAASGQLHHLRSITGRGWLALIASGVATGLSWLFYFAALKHGPISGVAPIDKLSFVIAMVLGFVVFGRVNPAPDLHRRRADCRRRAADLAGRPAVSGTMVILREPARPYGRLVPVRRRRGEGRARSSRPAPRALAADQELRAVGELEADAAVAAGGQDTLAVATGADAPAAVVGDRAVLDNACAAGRSRSRPRGGRSEPSQTRRGPRSGSPRWSCAAR